MTIPHRSFAKVTIILLFQNGSIAILARKIRPQEEPDAVFYVFYDFYRFLLNKSSWG
jgi:hypothetical protein